MLIRVASALLIVLMLLPAVRLCGADAAGDKAGTSAQSEPGQAAQGGHQKEVNPLEWNNQLAIWTAVVFLVLLAVLWKFAWGPIVAGLEKREQRMVDQIAQAEEANRQAKELLAQYEQKLARAQDDVRAVLEQARREAEQVGREMIAKAKADAQTEHQRALRQIDAATTTALKELADRAAVLAVELAGKILHAKLNPADHARLIKEAVNSFASHNASEN